jgi:hypothetical protein
LLNILAQRIPWLLGGSADLWPSTRTRLTFEGVGDFQEPGNDGDYRGRNIHFGVREHAMAAASNGLALSGLRPYASSFLVFTDYCRPGLRLSALMEVPVLYIWTHDSISVGEDGPTHQPVEHLAALRAMPGMLVVRPADANEVVEAYRLILRLEDRPACLVLSRQPLPVLDRSTCASASGLARGGYVLADAPDGKPDVLLLATGSEVSLCLAARDQLLAEGIPARVVSLPCWEVFEEQSPEYRESVLPADVTGESGGRRSGDLRLGALCRSPGHHPRYAIVRHVGPHEGGGAALRVCPGPRGCSGARTACPSDRAGSRVSQSQARRVLTINAGSSSLKAAVYCMGPGETRLLRLEASRIGRSDSWLQVIGPDGSRLVDGKQALPDHGAALDALLELIGRSDQLMAPRVAAHRVVHGGIHYWEPTPITPELVTELDALVPVDPEHMPQAVALIRAMTRGIPSCRRSHASIRDFITECRRWRGCTAFPGGWLRKGSSATDSTVSRTST